MNLLHAVDAVVVAGQRSRVDEAFPERLVENLVHQRALSRARRARDRDERAERNPHVDRLQVVLASALDHERLAVPTPPLAWPGDRPSSREELARRRSFALQQVANASLHHDRAAVHTGSWT